MYINIYIISQSRLSIYRPSRPYSHIAHLCVLIVTLCVKSSKMSFFAFFHIFHKNHKYQKCHILHFMYILIANFNEFMYNVTYITYTTNKQCTIHIIVKYYVFIKLYDFSIKTHIKYYQISINMTFLCICTNNDIARLRINAIICHYYMQNCVKNT